ncbi:hypothetical protein [Lysobacter antibioticus]|uniref:hypothetical protein n=1 Tax=Lysobacter antibioticus TaxID=84531 RepID=UPI0011404E37|nr:hypothetical protein [Lysobacter antibioticus]
MGTERAADAGLQVDVSVTIFLSPTQALGFASGTVEVAFLPEAQRAFPWPEAWLRQKPEYFGEGQSQVWSVERDAGGGRHRVLLYGIVCDGEAAAGNCMRFLERTAGMMFHPN